MSPASLPVDTRGKRSKGAHMDAPTRSLLNPVARRTVWCKHVAHSVVWRAVAKSGNRLLAVWLPMKSPGECRPFYSVQRWYALSC